MRVELIYSPGCNSYKKALGVLESVIAEERLPIAVEKQELTATGNPIIRVNGTDLSSSSHEFEGDPCFLRHDSSDTPCFEQLRHLLSSKWQELTAM